MLKAVLTKEECHEAILLYAEKKYPNFKANGGSLEIEYNTIVKAEIELLAK